MSASKKENKNNTPVEEKKVVKTAAKKTAQNEAIVELLDKKFEKLNEIEKRLAKVEERMGL